MDSKEATSRSSDRINGQDSAAAPLETQKVSNQLRELRLENNLMMEELEALRQAHQTLQSKYTEVEETVDHSHQEKEAALKHNSDLLEAIQEVSRLEATSREREVELVREKEEINRELENFKEKVEALLTENSEKSRQLSGSCLDTSKLIKMGLAKIIGSMDTEGEEHLIGELELDGDLEVELKGVFKFVKRVGLKFDEFKEKRKKEKRELEYGLVSLTEENRDINNLLRIALVEKEAVEKSLSKLKGNNEQKRGAILQIAERGLQKVGFSFMVVTGGNELSSETTDANAPAKTDSSSECEEEAVSLASTVERTMKNLRLEIAQLRWSLDESRSETERLQSLAETQAHKIEESTAYIKELEDRELMLTHHVEELRIEMKETEEEVAMWREACELEVQAGKSVTEEHEEVVNILKQELEKSRAALHASNSKLKLKDELVVTAIAAQEAAERSLWLADSRAVGLRDRIEEQTRQIEETEKRDRANRRRIRHICWPWRALKFNTINTTNNGVRNIREISGGDTLGQWGNCPSDLQCSLYILGKYS